MFLFELGDQVADRVTRFSGVVIGRAEHITGCNTYGVQPDAKDNKFEAAQWFDENRLEQRGLARVRLPEPDAAVAAPLAKTGAGPNPQPTRSVR